jgi:hypothetical protein
LKIQEISFTNEREMTYGDMRLDPKRISNTIAIDIHTNVSDSQNQHMNSQDYTIYYERGGDQIPTLGTSCPIYTKSLMPQQAQE